MLPQMMARVHPHSRYITANINQILTERLRAKIEDISIEGVVIEEDAAAIDRHLPVERVDLIAFQHAVNDILQTILRVQESVDTIYADWMETLPKTIQLDLDW